MKKAVKFESEEFGDYFDEDLSAPSAKDENQSMPPPPPRSPLRRSPSPTQQNTPSSNKRRIDTVVEKNKMSETQLPPPGKLQKLHKASHYKRKILNRINLKRNTSYISTLVDKAVERLDPKMSVNVPIKIMQDSQTIEQLIKYHFRPNSKMIENVCYCGAEKGQCESIKTGMPSETCSPPCIEVSWAEADLNEASEDEEMQPV